MDEAEQLCDRIGFLSGGRLVAEGTPLQLRQQVRGPRPVEEVDMETVFIELTGRRIEEDEDEDGAKDGTKDGAKDGAKDQYGDGRDGSRKGPGGPGR